MDDTELPVWTLAQHLAVGMLAIAKIDADSLALDPQRICHHFDEAMPVDPMMVSIEATYMHLTHQFAALGLDFLADRLEAWEIANPTGEWLETRISTILETTAGAGLEYRGWTWEPLNRQPIGATNIHVINNRDG